jgi:MscS family membrane protein
MSLSTKRPLKRVFPAMLLALLCTSQALAQDEVEPDVSARELIEAEQKTEQIIQEKSQSDPDALSGQATPLAAMLGLREAIRARDYERAGEFLDRRYVPEELEQYTDEELLHALGYVFGLQNIIDVASLSDRPEGNLNDGLPSYRDQIGTIILTSRDIPVLLQRVPDGKGGRVWKLSNATVAEIPAMWEELGYNEFAYKLGQWLPDFKFMGMANWQVAATVVFFIVAWPLAGLLSYLLMRLALLIPNRFPLGIQRFFKGPMRFFIFIVLARMMIDQLGLSLTARVLLESSGIHYIAFTVLTLGLMSLLRDYQIRKMQYAGNAQYVALLKPFTTIAKVLVVTIIGLYWAQRAGYNMSTILAGLGVGSLAVALAAQKTLENVIGAVTLYTARPVSAGDFCRFGKVMGIVEEIGLRSTLIRTLDRTMVVIPNAVFSSLEIENFSARDRIRYYRHFQMLLPDADQLRYMLVQVRKLLLSHPRVLQDTVSVRFENVVAGNAVLRLDAGVNTTDYQDYLAVAEDLNLRIVEIAQACGARFAGPGQSVQLRDTPATSDTQKQEAERAILELRDQERLPFPNYSEAERAEMAGSLDYPPKGSPS